MTISYSLPRREKKSLTELGKYIQHIFPVLNKRTPPKGGPDGQAQEVSGMRMETVTEGDEKR